VKLTSHSTHIHGHRIAHICHLVSHVAHLVPHLAHAAHATHLTHISHLTHIAHLHGHPTHSLHHPAATVEIIETASSSSHTTAHHVAASSEVVISAHTHASIEASTHGTTHVIPLPACKVTSVVVVHSASSASTEATTICELTATWSVIC